MQEENAAEGVELPEADLSEIDNAAVVKLIGGKPLGVLHALNEECVVPKGSDLTFLDKLLDTHKQNKLLSKCIKLKEGGFTIQHFVGPVTYAVKNLLLKNKDPVSEDLMVLLQRSRSPFVQALFSSQSETKSLLTKKKDTRFQGVVAKFQKQLEELLRLIGYSHMHFVRCVKPNRQKVPSEFVDDLVVGQLRCSGVFEAVRVIGMGFPDRLPHFVIIGQYARLLPEEMRPEVNDEGDLVLGESEAVKDVLSKLEVMEDEYAIGVSKVFLKAGVLVRLRQKQQEQLAAKAVVLQMVARGYIGRNMVMRLREERQRKLEEEAAAALAAAMAAEQAARDAAAALEAALTMAAEAEAADAAAAAQAEALSTALRQSAVDAIGEAESNRKSMSLGREGSLAENRWRSKLGSGQMRLKLKALAAMSGKTYTSGDASELAELSTAQKMVTARSQSRKLLLADPTVDPAGLQRADTKPKGLGLNLGALAKPNLALNTAAAGLLSHRDAGGGVAPLMSSRAPVRKDVKKAAAKQKKDAQWMGMVLEYATYLGMDADEDAELLWIAEQALRAPVPDGWEEMMDPFGDLYFYNETTSQSTRQHPMDAYYQQLYLKLRLQRRAGGFSAGPESMMPPPPAPEEKSKGKKGKRASISAPQGRLAERTGGMTSRAGGATKRGSISSGGGMLTGRGGETQRLGGMTSREGMTARDFGQQRHVISSVSEALEMSSPRSAKFMLDRFGLNDESKEDERCLLINPAVCLHHTLRVGTHTRSAVPISHCHTAHSFARLSLSRVCFAACLWCRYGACRPRATRCPSWSASWTRRTSASASTASRSTSALTTTTRRLPSARSSA